MDFSGLANLGWRDALIAISIVLALYIALIFLRIARLKRTAVPQSTPAPAYPTKDARAAIAAYRDTQEPSVVKSDELILAAEDTSKEPLSARQAERVATPWNEPPELSARAMLDARSVERIDALDGEMVLLRKDRKRLAAAEQELAQFRKEVGSLRAELMMLREELRESVILAENQLKQQPISPHYSEAMQLAMQGKDAEQIAQHCGIARAEADLVIALAKRQNES